MFSFGKNWDDFIKRAFNEERITQAQDSLRSLLRVENLQGKTFLDIGCGSGLFSLAALRLGATVTSFDVDEFSVGCAQFLKEREGSPESWHIVHGSVLDIAFLQAIDNADIVYSWGVLHHTGSMWEAIERAASKVNLGGLFSIAIYNKVGGVFGSRTWHSLKNIYNHSPRFIKTAMVGAFMLTDFAYTLAHGKNPVTKVKNYFSHRGMNYKTDIIDWVGGFPYEYATVEEIKDFCEKKLGMKLRNTIERTTLACNEFVFEKNI